MICSKRETINTVREVLQTLPSRFALGKKGRDYTEKKKRGGRDARVLARGGKSGGGKPTTHQ